MFSKIIFFCLWFSFDLVNAYTPEFNAAEAVLGILILLDLFLFHLCIPTRIKKHSLIFLGVLDLSYNCLSATEVLTSACCRHDTLCCLATTPLKTAGSHF